MQYLNQILAIDPGNTKSAFVILDKNDCYPNIFDIVENQDLLDYFDAYQSDIGEVVIEMITGYNMSVGQTVFDTCVWIGRFAERAFQCGKSVMLIPRREIKLHLCGNPRAKDKDITAALVDKFAPDIPNLGKGTKKEPGPFYGFKTDIWSAYAVGVSYLDWQKDNRLIPMEKLQFIESEERI